MEERLIPRFDVRDVESRKFAAEEIYGAPVKLDLGAQDISPPGFTPMGRFHGTEIYPLDVPDESVDEIRASHVLEHFPGANTVGVLTQWVSKLKPGGVLKVAVPNFEWIAKNYLDGRDINVQGYTMGGQVDANDFHHAIFDEECLAEALRLAGLIDIAPWASDAEDCSRLEVSLNLQGTKPKRAKPGAADPFKIAAVMSVPRLGFMDNFFCAFESLWPMGVKLRRHIGAYWEVGIERTIVAAIEEDSPEAILTLDYDTVFRQSDIERLAKIMRERPEVDALAPVQSARSWDQPLMTLDLPLGVKSDNRIPQGVFADDITELRTAHFGLTLIRTASLAKAKKPWLHGKPAPDGTWGEGRVDADIGFWRNWAASGLRLYSANRIAVGHLELMIRWPGKNFAPIFQLPKDYQKDGAPKDVWK